MGRFGSPQIGYLRDNDDNDIPELNKCPDCGAFFDGDICPICKKVCPEEMKAGNRRPPKKRKKREKSNYRRVPTDLYHQTWFIIIALFISRLVGIILVWTSDWKKWVKVVVTVIALFGVYICYAVGMVIFGGINGNPDGSRPTEYMYDTSDTESEENYKAQCRPVTYAELMRDRTGNAGTYIKGEYTVVKLTEGYEYKSGRYGDYIFASDSDGHIFAFFDRRSGGGGIVPGDKITVYGRFFLVSAVEGSGDRQKHPIAYAGYIDIGKAA